MVVYRLYGRDEEGKEQFIGTLPERRRDRKRITDESLINLSRTFLGSKAKIDLDSIRFVQIGSVADPELKREANAKIKELELKVLKQGKETRRKGQEIQKLDRLDYSREGDMKKHKAKQGEKTYLMKATLSDQYGRLKDQPFRVLAVPQESTLYGLAETIVDSFGFAFDHAFAFYDNIKKWPNSREGYELFADIGEESKFKGVKRARVNKVFDKVNKTMLFLFDYGDEWHFIVELKGIELAKEGVDYPFVVESVGGAPPQYGNEE